MMMFLPSTYPISRKPCRRASSRDAFKDAELETRTPMRQTFACCASANVPATRRKSVTIQNSFLFMAFPLSTKNLFLERKSVQHALAFFPAFIASSFNRSCYERDNGYKTHRAKRSCLFQAHYKNDDNLEGTRKRKQEAIWQSTFSFPPPYSTAIDASRRNRKRAVPCRSPPPMRPSIPRVGLRFTRWERLTNIIRV